MREHVRNLALKLVGCPYIWGGSNPWNGFDCSGFVVWCYQVFGILPAGDWTAQGLYDHFCESPRSDELKLLPGDLVFYGHSEIEIAHVMMVLDDELVVGASGGDQTTTTREVAVRRGAMVKVKRRGYRTDLVEELHVVELGK